MDKKENGSNSDRVNEVEYIDCIVIVGFHVLSFLNLKLPLMFLDFFLFH